MHGKNDKVVYAKNSVLLANAIENERGHITFKNIHGVGHIGILLSITGNKLFDTGVKQEIFKFIKNLH